MMTRPTRTTVLALSMTISALCLTTSSDGLSAQAPAASPLVMLSPSAIRADLAQFREQFLSTEASFVVATRAAAELRLSVLETSADTLHRAYLEVELARIVALADNGHTNAASALRAARFNRVGVRMAPFGEDFFVLRAQSSHASLLGARLVAIDGRPIAALRVAARALTGGTSAWRDRAVPIVLESPEQLQALGLVKSKDAANYRFLLLDGSTVERRMVGDAPDGAAGGGSTNRWLFPENPVSTTGSWQSLLATDNAPWSLRDPDKRFRFRDAPELDGVVIELRQVVNAPGVPILSFLAQMDTLLRTRKPTNVVLDLRVNGGGNLNLARGFVQTLPSLVSGRVFVLTSPYTFSAAISTTGYLKQSAPERVTIVGETVGDRLIFWAEGPPVTLTNSGIVIGHTKERHDYETGCVPYTDCHGNVVRNPIRVATFAPGINAPWTIDSFRSGVDPAMQAVMAALKR